MKLAVKVASSSLPLLSTISVNDLLKRAAVSLQRLNGANSGRKVVLYRGLRDSQTTQPETVSVREGIAPPTSLVCWDQV